MIAQPRFTKPYRLISRSAPQFSSKTLKISSFNCIYTAKNCQKEYQNLPHNQVSIFQNIQQPQHTFEDSLEYTVYILLNDQVMEFAKTFKFAQNSKFLNSSTTQKNKQQQQSQESRNSHLNMLNSEFRSAAFTNSGTQKKFTVDNVVISAPFFIKSEVTESWYPEVQIQELERPVENGMEVQTNVYYQNRKYCAKIQIQFYFEEEQKISIETVEPVFEFSTPQKQVEKIQIEEEEEQQLQEKEEEKVVIQTTAQSEITNEINNINNENIIKNNNTVDLEQKKQIKNDLLYQQNEQQLLQQFPSFPKKDLPKSNLINKMTQQELMTFKNSFVMAKKLEETALLFSHVEVDTTAEHSHPEIEKRPVRQSARKVSHMFSQYDESEESSVSSFKVKRGSNLPNGSGKKNNNNSDFDDKRGDKKNVVKNFAKAFRTFIYNKREKEDILKNVPHCDIKEFQSEFDVFLKEKMNGKFNNKLIHQLITSKSYKKLFQYFLGDRAEKWIQNSQIKEKITHEETRVNYLNSFDDAQNLERLVPLKKRKFD